MNRIGFSKQMILILLSLVALCSGSTMFISFRMTKELNNNLVMENLETINDTTYNLIDTSMKVTIKNYLRAISEKNLEIVESYYDLVLSGELTEAEGKEEVSKIFEAQSVGETGYVYVLNSEGILIDHPVLTGEDISDNDFVQNQIIQKSGYLEYLWQNPGDDIPQSKVIYMSYFEPWDYIISVSSYVSEFSNLVHPDDFRDNILSVSIGETGYITILDTTGNLIIHPFREGENISDSHDANGKYFIREMLDNTEGELWYPWINPGETELRDKVVVYKLYEPLGWYISSGVYFDEISAPIRLMQTRLFIASTIVFIISVIIAAIYSKIILRPIKKINHAMNKVIAGDYKVEIKDTRNDEIGELGVIFNTMILKTNEYFVKLISSNKQLEDLNENLEKKVLIRTHDLELISNQDGLTGLFNRRRLDEYLAQSWEDSIINKTHLSLLMIDIDFFKRFNDDYGHPEGDSCLIKVANQIKNKLRVEIDFVSRYGGEEFMVVLKNTNSDKAFLTSERIREGIIELQIPNKSSDIGDFLTVSIGVCTISSYDSKELSTFVEKTDKTLYKAKSIGRNNSYASKY